MKFKCINMGCHGILNRLDVYACTLEDEGGNPVEGEPKLWIDLKSLEVYGIEVGCIKRYTLFNLEKHALRKTIRESKYSLFTPIVPRQDNSLAVIDICRQDEDSNAKHGRVSEFDLDCIDPAAGKCRAMTFLHENQMQGQLTKANSIDGFFNEKDEFVCVVLNAPCRPG